ncbi:GTPase Era [Candidatus Bipolaricaulota bacterium]|nr:GTPase Era [Candidatus Bipolaricaulota bacterium]
MQHRAGFVGVLGQTNVGKSTLLNAIMGEKLLITSPKPQTTRNRVRCIYTVPDAQIVFVDTPGLHRPTNKLSRYILREAFRALRGVDLIYYVVEPWAKVAAYDARVLEQMEIGEVPVFLLVNKVDAARGNDVEETLLAYNALNRFQELFPISAKRGLETGKNLEDLLLTTIARLPEADAIFPQDVRIDQSDEFLVEELVREKVFLYAREEIPYSVAVRVKSIDPRDDDDLLDIRAELLVERDSQKGILIGKRGAMIKRIGSEARQDIEALFGRRVFLDLKVNVHKGWTRDSQAIDDLAGGGGAA